MFGGVQGAGMRVLLWIQRFVVGAYLRHCRTYVDCPKTHESSTLSQTSQPLSSPFTKQPYKYVCASARDNLHFSERFDGETRVCRVVLGR